MRFEAKMQLTKNGILKECWKEEEKPREIKWGTESRKYCERNGITIPFAQKTETGNGRETRANNDKKQKCIKAGTRQQNF